MEMQLQNGTQKKYVPLAPLQALLLNSATSTLIITRPSEIIMTPRWRALPAAKAGS